MFLVILNSKGVLQHYSAQIKREKKREKKKKKISINFRMKN